MTVLIKISHLQFERLLAGGAEVVDRDEGGVSYSLPDGRLIAELHDGAHWWYYIVKLEGGTSLEGGT